MQFEVQTKLRQQCPNCQSLHKIKDSRPRSFRTVFGVVNRGSLVFLAKSAARKCRELWSAPSITRRFLEMLMFFAEQKSIWNHRVTQLVRLAPGKNTMFLTALSARKSRRGRERILKIFRQKWSPKGDYLFIRNLGAICGYRVAFLDHKEITWLPTSMPPKRCT